MVVAERVGDVGVDLLDRHLRIARLQGRDARLDELGQGCVARPFRAAHRKRHHGLAIDARERAPLGRTVGHGAELVEPHFASARQGDRRLGKFVERVRARKRADRLFAARDFAAPAGQVHMRGTELAIDLGRRHAERGKPVGIECHADFALDPAHALDLRDAAYPLQIARDHVVHEPREFLDRHLRCACRIGHDRQARNIHALRDRLVDRARQIRTDARDRVFDVVERAVGRHFEAELDRGRAHALADARRDVFDAEQARDRILDLLRHLRFELGGCRPALRDRHRHEGRIDVRETRDGQLRKPIEPQHCQHQKQHDGGQRLFDGPGRNGECHDALLRRRLGAHAVAVAQEGGRTRHHEIARRNAGLDFGPAFGD